MMTIRATVGDKELTSAYRKMVLSKLTGHDVGVLDKVLIEYGKLIHRTDDDLGDLDYEIREATTEDAAVLRALAELTRCGYG